MGQLDGQSRPASEQARTIEQLLRTINQDLQGLKQGLIAELGQEVARLQAEKARLLSDIEKLQAYQQTLESRQQVTLSQQQLAQQQLWAKQLAQILADHLQGVIVQRLNQIASANQVAAAAFTSTGMPAATASRYSDNATRLLASLDSTFNTTFKTLQQDLNSYQSSLSQQINRMHSLEQQGEAILEALVARLREQLQVEMSRRVAIQVPPAAFRDLSRENGYPMSSVPGHSNGPAGYPTLQPTGYPPTMPPTDDRTGHRAIVPPSPPPTATRIPLEFPAAPLPVAQPKQEVSSFQLGLLMVLLSTVALSIHNVVVGVIGRESTVLGTFKLGGVLQFGPGNSLLTLWLRMLVVLPLMLIVAGILYPPVWSDIKKFLSSRDRRPIFNVVGSGFFLFLSQVLIYIAISQIGPGPAVTILFMYPIITVPLAWLLFGDRPSGLRWIVMATILGGVVLTAIPGLSKASSAFASGGVLMAVGSGFAFAFYLIFMQLGFKKLHPVPVSLIQFSTIFVLSSIILIFNPFPLNLTVQVDKPVGFLVGGIILGVLTLIGYLANNFGVRFMGAARASIIASSGPVMTALLAFMLIQSRIEKIQWVGIVLVTVGVAALSLERMKGQTPAQPSK